MPDKMSGQINISLTFAVTEISKYMLNLIIKPHAVIDKSYYAITTLRMA